MQAAGWYTVKTRSDKGIDVVIKEVMLRPFASRRHKGARCLSPLPCSFRHMIELGTVSVAHHAIYIF